MTRRPLGRRVGWEAASLAAVVALGAALRFAALADVPAGVQGDEAAAGLEARRILAEGWVGPYASSAAGSPTGFYYLVALAFRLGGESPLAVRVVAATLGTLTVPAVYLLLRRGLGPAAGLVGAFVVATSAWHIHYSRVAFPNVAWPLALTLGVAALAEALRGADRRWWAAAGAALALGLYTYNGHVLALGLIGLFLAGHALARAWALLRHGTGRRGPALRRAATCSLAFGAAFALVAAPMLLFAADPANDYFGYGRELSVFNAEEWRALGGPADRTAFLVDRYGAYWYRVCCAPEVDPVDGTGVLPAVGPLVLLLALAGLVAVHLGAGAVPPLVGLATLVVLALPLASALTVDFVVRRSMGILPFLALFAALGAAELVGVARRFPRPVRLAQVVLLGLVLLASAGLEAGGYFRRTVPSEPMRETMAAELVEASRHLATLPAGTHVYFYSDRWPIRHEIRRFLAPDARGEDRSLTFDVRYGGAGAEDPVDRFWREGLERSRGQSGPAVFLLLDRYRDLLAELQARHPGGTVVRGGETPGPEPGPTFVAYALPPRPGPSSAEPPPDPGPPLLTPPRPAMLVPFRTPPRAAAPPTSPREVPTHGG